MPTHYPHLRILGVTGKIATGKSTVARILERKGWTRIDCDEIVRDLYQPGNIGAHKIRMFFDDKYLLKSGEVNRRKLLAELFRHPKKWEVLSRMIHPLVADELRRRLQRIKQGNVVIEIQIYTQKTFGEFFDQMWVITSTPKHQLRRLKEKGITAEQLTLLNKARFDEPHPKSTTFTNNSTQAALEKKIESSIGPPEEG